MLDIEDPDQWAVPDSHAHELAHRGLLVFEGGGRLALTDQGREAIQVIQAGGHLPPPHGAGEDADKA